MRRKIQQPQEVQAENVALAPSSSSPSSASFLYSSQADDDDPTAPNATASTDSDSALKQKRGGERHM